MEFLGTENLWVGGGNAMDYCIAQQKCKIAEKWK
jgi:hypothetical protein